MNRKASRLLRPIAIVFFIGFIWVAIRSNRPMQVGAKSHYYRINKPTSIALIYKSLAKKGILRSVSWAKVFALIHRAPDKIARGTYLIGPGESTSEIISALTHPIIIKFRIPDTNWAERNAHLLQEHSICSAKNYMADVQNPSRFQKYVDFPLPEGSLEGYLYPDTYSLEPLTPASDIIEEQLKIFQSKVYDRLGKPNALFQLVTIGSLIQLEVGRKEEMPLVSAVIYNRLKKKMRLQIDASLNYAIGKWRPLKISDLRKIPGPYNLYTHKGLPPGPICSPTYNSILAAMNPANVNYLYYVALPNGHSLFASTYAQHKRNIQKRKQAIADLNRTRNGSQN